LPTKLIDRGLLIISLLLYHLGLNLPHLNFWNYQLASFPKSKIQNPKSKMVLGTSSLDRDANRACTSRFATIECGVTVVIQEESYKIEANFLALGDT